MVRWFNGAGLIILGFMLAGVVFEGEAKQIAKARDSLSGVFGLKEEVILEVPGRELQAENEEMERVNDLELEVESSEQKIGYQPEMADEKFQIEEKNWFLEMKRENEGMRERLNFLLSRLETESKKVAVDMRGAVIEIKGEPEVKVGSEFQQISGQEEGKLERALSLGTREEKKEDEVEWCPLAGEWGENKERVIFNEVNLDKEGQWIELFNRSGLALRLKGWQMRNLGGDIKIKFTDKDKINPTSLFLMERGSDRAVEKVRANLVYGGFLEKEDRLFMFDERCGLVDEVTISTEEIPEGRTWQRMVSNLMARSSVEMGGSPGERNGKGVEVEEKMLVKSKEAPEEENKEVAAAETGEEIKIKFSRIRAGSEISASDEFLEIYNQGDYEADLTGWQIKKKTATGSESVLVVKSRLEGIKIGAGEKMIMANEGGYQGQATVWWPKSNTLAYTNNAVVLYDAGEEKVDEVGWESLERGEVLIVP